MTNRSNATVAQWLALIFAVGALSLMLWLNASAKDRALKKSLASSTAVVKRTLRIGMTADDIVERNGATRSAWMYGEPIRKTVVNEYKFRLEFEADRSQSQFHPTDRLKSIRLTVDHPSRAAEILQDMPEAVELCQHGCPMFGRSLDTYPNQEHDIVVYVPKPTADQHEIAARSQISWR